MTVATLAHSNIVHSRSYRIEAGQSRKTKKCLACVLIIGIFVFGLAYVLEANNIAAKDYKISELQKEAKQTESLNKSIQIEVSNLKSINILEASSNNLRMVKAQKVDYVSSTRTSAMLAK